MTWQGLAACALLLAACDAGSDATFAGEGGSGPASGSGGDGGTFATSSGMGGSAVSVGSGGGSGGSEEIAEVYGHSASDLYKLDPITKDVTLVGPFNGCSAVIDIAIDKDGFIVGTTFDGIYRIDKTTAQCTIIASGGYPNSLSFVPEGTVDPNVEALVGYNGSTYVRIDPQTGSLSNIGAISSGFISSGDVVSVKDGGTYLTVKGQSCDDCIVEVNPSTGDLIQNLGTVGYVNVYGLAFWGGAAYGFTEQGELFEITFNGSSVTTMPIPIPSAPANLFFWGAGSTTSAPLTPPPE